MTKELQRSVRTDGLIPVRHTNEIQKYIEIRAFSRIIDICEDAIRKIDNYKKKHPIMYYFSEEVYDAQRAEIELVMHQSAAREAVEIFIEGLSDISNKEELGMFNSAKDDAISMWERVCQIQESDDLDKSTEDTLAAIKDLLEILLKNDNANKSKKFKQSLDSLLRSRSKNNKTKTLEE